MSESYFIYAADCWCPSCAENIKERILGDIAEASLQKFREMLLCDFPSERAQALRHAIAEVLEEEVDELAETDYDSDNFPKGPFGEEAVDSPSHCGAHSECLEAEVLEDGSKIGKLLGTTLTNDGIHYVAEQLFEGALREDGPSLVEKFWAEQFDTYDFSYPMKIKLSNIEYDFSTEDMPENVVPDPVPPKEMIVDVQENPLDNDAIAEAATEVVSELTGWLVSCAEFQILNPASPDYPKE